MTVRNIARSLIEEAGMSIEQHGVTPTLFDTLVDELQRANRLLDVNKDKIVFQILNIQNVADLTRAVQSYTRSFLLSQPLSLATVQEICSELCLLAAKYKTVPPSAWKDIVAGDFKLATVSPDLAEEEVEERYRVDM